MMKLSRFKKWLLVFVMLMPCFFLLERERRVLIIVGSWQFLDKNETPGESKSNFHIYYVFNRDGSGESVVEENGVIGSFPFTYEVVGLSRIKIESDQSFCGTDVIRWDEDCEENNSPKFKIKYTNVSIGIDRNSMQLVVPKESRNFVGRNYFKRVDPHLVPTEN